MKIYLSTQTVGKYGGGLNGSLKHLDNYIQTEINKSNFKSSFDELWITIVYPPMFVLKGIIGMEKQFPEFYNKLPNSRINRRYKKIDVVIKAPEFSEHLDKKDSLNQKYKFSIDKKFQNISEIDLARVLIDKYLEAGEIITSKLKKGDLFDIEVFNSILTSIKDKINTEFITTLNLLQKEIILNETLERAKKIRKDRNQVIKEKDKIIKDIRVYTDFSNKALYPYDYQYTEIFTNLLVKSNFKCPTYHHLYIQISENESNALKNTFSIEDWYVYGIATIDYEKYKKQTEKEKDQVVFNAISKGLHDIAKIDKLDILTLNSVIEKIKVKGLETELHYQTIDNNNHKLEITYFSKSREEKCPIYFNITDKNTNQSNRLKIGEVEKEQIHMWMQKITMTKKVIKIKSSNSVKADVWLKDLPRKMEFNISEIIE